MSIEKNLYLKTTVHSFQFINCNICHNVTYTPLEYCLYVYAMEFFNNRLMFSARYVFLARKFAL